MLIHYEADNTYDIKQDTANAYKVYKPIKVQYDSKWFNGMIIYYGYEKRCKKHSKNIEDGKPINTDTESEASVYVTPKETRNSNYFFHYISFRLFGFFMDFKF
jgi:hypothetical protein